MRRTSTTGLGEYRGREITVGSDGMFRCNELSLENKTFDGLKALIDEGSKSRVDTLVYYMGYHGSEDDVVLEKVMLTSVVRERWSEQAYITHANKRREKVHPGSLYAISDENKKKLDTIISNREEVARLRKENERIEKSLQPAVK